MFSETIKTIRDGALNAEAEERLREVVAAVLATGKPGKLSITFTVKTASKNDKTALVVADQTKVTLPQTGAGETVLFATREGGLSRRDSRQPELMGLAEPKRPAPFAPRGSDSTETTKEGAAQG